jgi:hypothetical protein
MAKKMQPVSSWQNGEEKEATVFVLTSTYDNLSTTANFQYQLNQLIPTPPTPPTPTLQMYNTLVTGALTMSGQDYLDWDAAIDANDWAYNWAATALKLVLVAE